MPFVTASYPTYASFAAIPGPDVIALTCLPVSMVFRCPRGCLHLIIGQGITRSHWQISKDRLGSLQNPGRGPGQNWPIYRDPGPSQNHKVFRDSTGILISNFWKIQFRNLEILENFRKFRKMSNPGPGYSPSQQPWLQSRSLLQSRSQHFLLIPVDPCRLQIFYIRIRIMFYTVITF